MSRWVHPFFIVWRDLRNRIAAMNRMDCCEFNCVLLPTPSTNVRSPNSLGDQNENFFDCLQRDKQIKLKNSRNLTQRGKWDTEINTELMMWRETGKRWPSTSQGERPRADLCLTALRRYQPVNSLDLTSVPPECGKTKVRGSSYSNMATLAN